MDANGWLQILFYVATIAVLLWRPTGLFGAAHR